MRKPFFFQAPRIAACLSFVLFCFLSVAFIAPSQAAESAHAGKATTSGDAPVDRAANHADHANHADRQAGHTAEDVAGLDLLRQASAAWRAGNFRGRFIYVRGNRMESMQVVHAVIDGVEHERLSHLDDSTAEIIRRGDETINIHPNARVTRFDVAANGGPFRTFTAMADSVAQHYQVRRAAPSRVAGRSADFVSVGPRDAYRYGYRLWVDRESRLPLRYEVVSRKGVALESVEFIDVETGIQVPRELFTPPASTDGHEVASTSLRSTDAPMPAVTPSWLPPGFSMTDSQMQGEKEHESAAITYSDGLAAFSFFVEKVGTDAKPMGRQIGPTVAVSGVLDAASAGKFRVTLVGEIPASAAVKVVESARYRAPQQGPDKSAGDIPVKHHEE